MRKNTTFSAKVIVGLFILLFTQQAWAASTIAGVIYDFRSNPLPDIDVELYGETSYRARARTDSNGKYQFDNLGDGRFTITILPFRYDFEEQTDTVIVQTVSYTPGGGSDYQMKDFYLKPRKGSLVENEASVVFSQDIPLEAKKAFEKAAKDFSKKKPEEGIAALNAAIKIFPNYFSALFELGKQHFFKGNYGEATNYMLRAADINNKSGWSFYYLGYSLLKLNYYKAASVALNQAYVLSPSSVAVLLALGTSDRLAGKYIEAEKHLKLAKKISKKPIPDIHRQLAVLYAENLKKYAEAAAEIEEYLKARPDDPDAINLKKIAKNLKEKAQSTSKTN